MALGDEDLPAVAGALADRPVMTQTQLLESLPWSLVLFVGI